VCVWNRRMPVSGIEREHDERLSRQFHGLRQHQPTRGAAHDDPHRACPGCRRRFALSGRDRVSSDPRDARSGKPLEHAVQSNSGGSTGRVERAALYIRRPGVSDRCAPGGDRAGSSRATSRRHRRSSLASWAAGTRLPHKANATTTARGWGMSSELELVASGPRAVVAHGSPRVSIERRRSINPPDTTERSR
jgi:hypothetical protein